MHTSNSFTDIKSPLLYYNNISKSAGHTKIIEEGQEDEIAFSDKSQNCCVSVLYLKLEIQINQKILLCFHQYNGCNSQKL